MGNKFANKGVRRNKKPLKNIVYSIHMSQFEEVEEKYEKFKFKDLGFITLTWWYESNSPIKMWHGFIEPKDLKELLGEKQWGKFCQGKRVFVNQRRINGKNV